METEVVPFREMRLPFERTKTCCKQYLYFKQYCIIVSIYRRPQLNKGLPQDTRLKLTENQYQ